MYFLSVGQVHPDCWMISVAAQMPTLTQSLTDLPNANWAKNPPTNASPRSRKRKLLFLRRPQKFVTIVVNLKQIAYFLSLYQSVFDIETIEVSKLSSDD